MAGITEELKKEHFYKGDYIDNNPISLMKKEPQSFDYVIENSSTNKYLTEIKKLLQK
jgi:hypothetical protein